MLKSSPATALLAVSALAVIAFVASYTFEGVGLTMVNANGVIEIVPGIVSTG